MCVDTPDQAAVTSNPVIYQQPSIDQQPRVRIHIKYDR